jgi:hypothetical protein
MSTLPVRTAMDRDQPPVPIDRDVVELDVSKLAVGGVVDVERLDKAWRDATSDDGAIPVAVVLKDSAYLDNETLVWFLAMVRSAQAGLVRSFHIDLPEIDSTRMNFLRGWRFIEALREITNGKLSTVLTERSTSIVDHLDEYAPRYIKVIADPYGARETLVSESFFALVPLRIEDSDYMIAHRERSRWLEKHIVAVLDNQLKPRSTYQTSPGAYFATDVVYEAALNIGRHPNAKVAYTTSQVQRQTSIFTGIRSELVLCFWDDGASYAQSLGEALQSGGIRSGSFGSVSEEFSCEYTDLVEKTTRRDFFEANEWNEDPTPEGLMVAAFLLGITAEPDGPASNAPTLVRERPEITQFRGAGLHLLRSMAIRELGGTVTYKSGEYRLEISGSSARPRRYKVRVVRERGPYLAGNLLTIRVPVES